MPRKEVNVMNIENRIDTDNDTIEVIKAKIEAMKKEVASGAMTQAEYNAEKERVMKELRDKGLVGYAFTW